MTPSISSARNSRGESPVRYEPDENPPAPLAIGLGIQSAMVQIAGIILTPVIVVRAAGLEDDPYLLWAVFAAVAVSGLTTILQAVRLGRFGAGHVLTMGTSGAFIAVSVTALREGGPALLASLVIVSSLFQFLLAYRLSWLRRLVTPTIAGTVIMLIAVTVMPIVFPMFSDVPDGVPASYGAIVFGVTLVVSIVIALRGAGAIRLWAPLIGVLVGSFTAAILGLYDAGPVREAAWVGVPAAAWPGVRLEFGAAFWSLLPAFLFVTLVGAIETIGDAIAIQRVSRRKPRTPDYRVVEGAVAADGAGNLLSGLAVTVPNTTYSSSIAVAELTGVASRRIGIWIGVAFLTLALLPKGSALFLAIPNPVVGAFALVTIGILFALGMRLVVQDGMNMQKAVVVGVSFWVGAGFQSGAVFGEYLGAAGALLENGMTAGGLTAIVLMLFLNLTGPRPRRLDTGLGAASGERIRDFLSGMAAERHWDRASHYRLLSAAEEALLTLAGDESEAEGDEDRRLRLTARISRRAAELEFVASAGDANLEDQMALMSEHAESPEAGELSLRLLRHYASEVRHQKYYGLDIVTVKVEARA